jgi:LPS-assembly lipoprotein
MTRLRILAGLLMLPVTLAGCGLQPLYSGGSTGAVAGALGQVEIAPIEGKAGWLMATALRDRMPSNGNAPLYRVDIRLDDQISGLGVRRDDSVSRERRVLRARYQLVRIGDGSVLLDATAGSDAGIDVVRSEYATIAAENTALERLSAIVADQIVARIALYARRTPTSRAVIDPPATSPTP